ncbi:unnamed protein product, partial [Vitis vinifera]
GCDHTSTNAPHPIGSPQLCVLGRDSTRMACLGEIVLGWVTSWEVLVWHPFSPFATGFL